MISVRVESHDIQNRFELVLDSIMHYTYNSFSTNGLPVMVTANGVSKDWRYTMGTGNVLTESDIYKVKKIYGCA